MQSSPRFLLAILFSFSLSFGLNAQTIWTDSFAKKEALQYRKDQPLPSKFRLLDLNASNLAQELNTKSTEEICIDIPMPDGSEECFVLEAYSAIPNKLATQRPDIKTFRGRSLHNPKARLHLVQTINDIHIIGDSDNGNFFIDKVVQSGQMKAISYFAKDEIKEPVVCQTEAHMTPEFDGNIVEKTNLPGLSWGTTLNKYRLAILWKHEASATHNNVIADIINRSVEIVADMNFICERDMSVTFELAPNPEALIFTSEATDPYDGLGANTGIINGLIGSENYEIGMALTSGGGGVSYLSVTCGGLKGGTFTPDHIDYYTHELGHNMGAGHTMNYCPGGGFNDYEAGSGNTLMGYQYLCGSANIPGGQIRYFHSSSISEMYNKLFVNTSCAEVIATNNNPPVATVPTGGFSIPKSTPFTLTGSATDPDGTSDFTYSWEQFNSGNGSPPWAPSGDGPVFRFFEHSISPIRTVPQIGDIINGYTMGEILPDYARTLNWRFYARDNNVLGRGITYEELEFFVDGNSGPFTVNYPNGSSAVWAEGQTATITWDVANTDQAPVNSTLVDILLSTDGGFTYPITLATAVPNDGSEDIIAPNNIGTTNRIKVAANDNIFFDISDSNFEIVAAGTEDFLAFANENNKSTCTENTISYPVELFQVGAFNNTIEVTITGLPTGATSNLPLVIPSSGISMINLASLDNVLAGNYPMQLTLTETGGGLVKTLNLNYLKKENLITPSPDKAMSFDGSGQIHIQKNNADFNFGQSKDFSVEFWTKTTTTSGDDAIISDKNWDSGNNKGWVIMMQNGAIGFNAGTGSSRVDIGSNGATFNDGEWHHVAVSLTREGLGNLQLYVDGKLLSERSLTGLGDIDSIYDLVIGADKNNNYRYEGEIDEVRIWKKALSANEIRENMHRVIESCHSDLISCYQFNETTGNALDAFSLHHGSVSSSNRVTSSAPFGTGIANSQVENNGSVIFTNTDFQANYTNQANANVTATKINLSPYGSLGIDANDVIFDNQYWVLNRYETTGNLTFDATFSVSEDITIQEVNTPLSLKLYGRNFNSDTEWTLLTYGASADETNNTVTFENITTYGQYLITKSESPVIAVYDDELAFCNLAMGGASEILSYQLSAAFLTEDLSISVPSGFSISTLPNSGFSNSLTISPSNGEITAMTIYVRFEPNAAGYFDGSIDHNSTGALIKTINISGTSIQPQAYNSVVFDGSNNIHIPKINTDLDFADNRDFSIEFWTKTTTTSNDVAIISDKDWDSGGYAGWVIAMQHGAFVFNAGSGGGVRVDLGSGSVDYNDNAWHHVALSFNRSGNWIELYVDGFLKGSRDLNGVGNINTTLDLVIGADALNSYSYAGTIEEVRIWGKALTSNEVRENMHLITTGCKSDLIASYHLDDTNSVATDDTGALHGTMNNVVSIASSAPIGPGASNTQTEAVGNVVFANTDITNDYSLEMGVSVTASKLTVAPNAVSGVDPSDDIFDSQYWVLNDYENTGNLTFDATFKPTEDISPGFVADVFKLYGRNFNSDTDWSLITDVSAINTTSNEVTFADVEQYGQYLIAKNSVVLPLDLLTFTGYKNRESVVLDWTTTNEENVASFEIQRKTSTGIFEKIGWLNAKGNSDLSNEYSFEDQTVIFSDDNYYRLKIIDFSGEFKYSNTIIILRNKEENSLVLYPNPTSGRLFINNNFIQPNLTLNLFGANGQFLKRVNIKQNNQEINIKHLPSGVYYYNIVGESYTKNGRLVIH